MPVFTSGRDYRPHAFFGLKLPPDVGYVRVLVVADDLDQAGYRLCTTGVQRYAESLRPVTSVDGPAEAVTHYLASATPQDDHPVFLVYTRNYDRDGGRLPVPRFYTARLVGGDVVPVGRVRVVGMGQPTDPHPVVRLVDDDQGDDPVPLPADVEGPGGDLVEGVLPYPRGALGVVVRRKERQVIDGLTAMRGQVDQVLADIAQARTSSDPRLAWLCGARDLLKLSTQLAELAAQASVVEATLQAGAD